MPASRPRLHYGWIVLAAVFLIMLTASGLRAVLGVFIKPIETEFGWERSAMSRSRRSRSSSWAPSGLSWDGSRTAGARGVMALFLAIVGAGAMLSSRGDSFWEMMLTAGVIMAIGAGGMGMATASTIAARWFEARRGLVMGILGAGMSAGQLVMIPLAVWITTRSGWRRLLLLAGRPRLHHRDSAGPRLRARRPES